MRLLMIYQVLCVAPQLHSIADDPDEMVLSWSSSLRANARQGYTVEHKELS